MEAQNFNELLPLVDKGSSEGGLFLNRKNLSTLLSPVENLPISVISVVGPSKTGKSLLVGYLIRYFGAAEQDELDWLDSKNPDKEFTELRWPSGKSPEQPGIWCYPRPFIISNEDKTETKQTGVILLYCQPSDKIHWDSECSDACAFIGLTCIISSNTIFNLYKHLDEECLATIGTSVKLSAHALASMSSKKGKTKNAPLQNVCFALRDWNFCSQYPYGIRGGREFVKLEKLKEKPNHSRKSRESRQLINGLFADTSGCLFQYPGAKLSSATNQNYSVAELGKDFVKLLSDFISTAVNVDELVLKRGTDGQNFTGKMFQGMVERSVETLTDVDASSINTARILKRYCIKPGNTREEQKECIKPAMKAFTDIWKKYERSDKLLDEKTLRDAQKRATKKAMSIFEAEVLGKTPGDDGHSSEEDSDSDSDPGPKIDSSVKKGLISKILARFEEIKKQQAKNRLAQLEKEKVELIEQYREIMGVSFPSNSNTVAETKFKRQSKQLIAKLNEEFLEKIGVEEDMDDMDEKQETEMQDFKERLAKEEELLIEKLFGEEGESSSVYGDRLYPSISGTAKDPWENDSTSSNISRDASFIGKNRSLHKNEGNFSSRQSEVSNDDLEYEPPVKAKLQNPKTVSREELKRKEEKLREQTKSLVERLKTIHQDKLDECLQCEDSNLDDFQKESLAEIFETFRKQVPYDNDRDEFNQYKAILTDELELVYSQAKLRKRQMTKKREEGDNEAIKKAVQSFQKQLENLLEDHISVKAFHGEKKIMDEEMGKLRKILKLESSLEAAKEEMEKVYQKLKIQQRPAKDIKDDQAQEKVAVKKIKEEYLKLMSSANAKGKTELEEQHHDVVEKLAKTFGNIVDSKSVVKVIKDAYEDVAEKFNLKQENKAGSAMLAVREARDYYCQEMSKRLSSSVFLTPNALLKLNETVSKEAKRKYAKAESDALNEALKLAFKRFEDENAMNKSGEPAIGIDLGTTYCCVSVYQKGRVVILPNSVGKYTTPSYVLFDNTGKEIVGEPAKTRAYEHPEGTIFDAKRILGRKFDDPKLQNDMKLWAFTVVDGGRGVPMIEVNGKRYHPEMISAKILKQLKIDAETYLKQKVTKAVITVPAYFTDGQKQATIDAGKMAGLEVLSILTEPVAAAMAYKLQYSVEEPGAKDRHVLVFDLGGGTFDVAVVKASKGKLDVLTVDGDTHLGGEDFDKNLMEYCAQEFKKKHGVDLFEGKDSQNKPTRDDVRRRLKRIQAVCEIQKIALTTARSIDVSVDNIYKNMDLEVTVSRATFEKINDQLFQKTIQVVDSALKAAKLTSKQIDDIVLVGGSTRIPKVQNMLRDFFNGKELDKKINPDEAVANGAGLMAAIRQGSVGKTSAVFTKIQDVTPMSIGVEVYGGGFSAIIPKSTKIPVMLKERYKTAHNNQTSVQITIYEGENKIAIQNKHLGDFYLNGIPPKDAGVENIDVEMLINEQGILHVTAKCSSTGGKSSVTVTENKQRMGQATINRYLAEG